MNLRTVCLMSLALALALAMLLLDSVTVKADTNCFSTYNSGSGANLMNFCVSQNGTIPDFESPATSQELVSEEGYAVASGCGTGSPLTHGADAGISEGGFTAPAITQPNGLNTFPLIITRSTTDGVFSLLQSFSRNTSEKSVSIKMTLKNTSSTAVSNVFLTRYFTDAVFITLNRFARSFDSVWGWDGYAFSATALTFGTTHATVVQDRNTWLGGGTGGLGDGCWTTSLVDTATPTGSTSNGWAGRVVYQLGTMSAGSSKTVNVMYRRY